MDCAAAKKQIQAFTEIADLIRSPFIHTYCLVSLLTQISIRGTYASHIIPIACLYFLVVLFSGAFIWFKIGVAMAKKLIRRDCGVQFVHVVEYYAKLKVEQTCINSAIYRIKCLAINLIGIALLYLQFSQGRTPQHQAFLSKVLTLSLSISISKQSREQKMAKQTLFLRLISEIVGHLCFINSFNFLSNQMGEVSIRVLYCLTIFVNFHHHLFKHLRCIVIISIITERYFEMIFQHMLDAGPITPQQYQDNLYSASFWLPIIYVLLCTAFLLCLVMIDIGRLIQQGVQAFDVFLITIGFQWIQGKVYLKFQTLQYEKYLTRLYEKQRYKRVINGEPVDMKLLDYACPICLQESIPIRVLDGTGFEGKQIICGHCFHDQCLYRWVVSNNKPFCPLCKNRVEAKIRPQCIDFHYII